MSVDYRVYLRMRDKYLINAEQLVAKGEFRKASEMLWGAIAQAVKAVAAARKGIRIEHHRELVRFVRELSKELGDEEMYKRFLLVRQLHQNFYDEVIDPEDFHVYMEEAYRLLIKLDSLLEGTK